MSFLGEIKRRKVFQVAAVYLVASWLIMQVVDVVAEPLLLPDWFPRVVIVLLAIGFPIAIILSWAFDLTARGVERTQAATPGEEERVQTMATTTGLAVNLAVIGALGLAVIVAGVYVFWRDEPATIENETDPEFQPQVLIDVARDVLPNSVAVLPFANQSLDPENEFFADGIHFTILNELAKIAAINVIGRSSVLGYADNQTPISQIAKELNVETVMEGTVQYAGNQVRITLQLLNPTTQSLLWSANYDRDFDDILAIQSDIAMNVANALQAEFSLQEQARIELVPTDSREAYALYLRSIAAWGDPQGVWRSLIDQAIGLDPNFALAHARKAYMYAASPALVVRQGQLIRDAAERALDLNPEMGLAHAALALLYQSSAQWEDAKEASESAVLYSPNDPAVFESYGVLVSFP